MLGGFKVEAIPFMASTLGTSYEGMPKSLSVIVMRGIPLNRPRRELRWLGKCEPLKRTRVESSLFYGRNCSQHLSADLLFVDGFKLETYHDMDVGQFTLPPWCPINNRTG